MNGVLIIDKPAGLTSHDVVNRVRRILHQRSIGHLGTLDPMATGVLPLVTGTLTRLAQFYTSSEKCYEGTIRFGFATDYLRRRRRTHHRPPTSHPDADRNGNRWPPAFRGVIEQTPPPFSAKKIHGVPAYKLARKQKEVVLKPVQVEIKEFGILGVDADRARFRARVASGTYMRSVAHDMGKELGLRRAPRISAPHRRCRIHPGKRPHPRTTRRSGRERRTAVLAQRCRKSPTRCGRVRTPRRFLRPSPQTPPAYSLRHRRRTHRRPHSQRTHRQSP